MQVLSFPLEFPPPEADEMKLRAEDKEELFDEIHKSVASSVETAMAAAVDSFRPHGWRRVTNFLREWGYATTIITVPLTLLAMLITLAIFAANVMRDQGKFQQKTEDRLDHIESILVQLQAKENPGEALKELSTFTTKHLAENLSTLRTLSEGPVSQVPPNDSALRSVSAKLANVSADSYDYWPTVESLVNYRSALTPGVPTRATVFPPCQGPTDLDSTHAVLTHVDPNGKPFGPTSEIARIRDQDCTVTLDGTPKSRWDCTHCIVVYSGGPVSLRDVHFIDCLFIFTLPAHDSPAPSGQQFSKELLASDLKDVTVGSS